MMMMNDLVMSVHDCDDCYWLACIKYHDVTMI